MGRRQNKRSAWIENGCGRNYRRKRQLCRGAAYRQQEGRDSEATGAHLADVTLHRIDAGGDLRTLRFGKCSVPRLPDIGWIAKIAIQERFFSARKRLLGVGFVRLIG